MEPVTHFLTGACLGRTGFNRKTAYATLAMTLAAEAPDLDMLWGFKGPVEQLQHHRGWTHAFIGTPVVALATLAVVWLVWRLRRKDPVIPPRWGFLYLCALIAALSHILLDYTVNYGVRPFFPWNPHWYAWNIEFIFDPIWFLALLLALVIPWILGLADREIGAKKKPFRGRGWAVAGLVFVVLWWGLRNAEHLHALELVQTGSYTREPLIRVAAEPHMASPFDWHVVMETKDYYQTAEVHTIGDRVETDAYDDVIYKPSVTPAVTAAEQTYLGKIYLDWSKWPVVTDLGHVPVPGVDVTPEPNWHTVEFQDLRFGYWPLGSERAGRPRVPPLSGWVYVGPGNEIEGMFMQGHEQKNP
ncbi:MAG TPA: metal-dependent hydrolase [Acidobacteriaceae bacterium]|jgi:inner membrane protein|nr:metal-dependent hydrolase [Acidobacteriaceae bacterium]